MQVGVELSYDVGAAVSSGFVLAIVLGAVLLPVGLLGLLAAERESRRWLALYGARSPSTSPPHLRRTSAASPPHLPQAHARCCCSSSSSPS